MTICVYSPEYFPCIESCLKHPSYKYLEPLLLLPISLNTALLIQDWLFLGAVQEAILDKLLQCTSVLNKHGGKHLGGNVALRAPFVQLHVIVQCQIAANHECYWFGIYYLLTWWFQAGSTVWFVSFSEHKSSKKKVCQSGPITSGLSVQKKSRLQMDNNGFDREGGRNGHHSCPGSYPRFLKLLKTM